MKTFSMMTVLLCAATLSGCEKNAVQEITGTLPTARVKFFNFGVGAPGVNFYANEVKMTAIVSATGAESVLGVAYGAAGAGGFYSALDPGSYALRGRIAAATDKDLTVATVTTPLADGKAYSFYMSGPYDAVAKSVDAFVVEDDFPATIDFAQAYVRFVHTISNAQPMTLYVKNATTAAEVPIGAAVAYKGAGTFVPVAGGVYDLGARLAGVATNAVSRTAVSFSAGRVYTISSRGDITVTSATATNRPQLDNTANR
jgi:hypothetical protein